MKVRKGTVYVYRPRNSLFEMADAKSIGQKGLAEDGQLVRVIHCHGCPPPNTMGHAHVESLDGTFLGLVHTVALEPNK